VVEQGLSSLEDIRFHLLKIHIVGDLIEIWSIAVLGMIHMHMMLSAMEQSVHIQHWMKILDMLNLEAEDMLEPVTIILILLPVAHAIQISKQFLVHMIALLQIPSGLALDFIPLFIRAEVTTIILIWVEVLTLRPSMEAAVRWEVVPPITRRLCKVI